MFLAASIRKMARALGFGCCEHLINVFGTSTWKMYFVSMAWKMFFGTNNWKVFFTANIGKMARAHRKGARFGHLENVPCCQHLENGTRTWKMFLGSYLGPRTPGRCSLLPSSGKNPQHLKNVLGLVHLENACRHEQTEGVLCCQSKCHEFLELWFKHQENVFGARTPRRCSWRPTSGKFTSTCKMSFGSNTWKILSGTNKRKMPFSARENNASSWRFSSNTRKCFGVRTRRRCSWRPTSVKAPERCALVRAAGNILWNEHLEGVICYQHGDSGTSTWQMCIGASTWKMFLARTPGRCTLLQTSGKLH